MITMSYKNVKALAFKISRITDFKQTAILQLISNQLGFSDSSSMKHSKQKIDLSPDVILKLINFLSKEMEIDLYQLIKFFVQLWPSTKDIFSLTVLTSFGKNSVLIWDEAKIMLMNDDATRDLFQQFRKCGNQVGAEGYLNERANKENFLSILDKVPSVEPEEQDKL